MDACPSDIEKAHLAFDPSEEAPINAPLGASIMYRIATGPREARKCLRCRRQEVSVMNERRRRCHAIGDQGTESIRFLDEIRSHDIPVERLNRVAGYKPNNAIQGFNLLGEEESAPAV